MEKAGLFVAAVFVLTAARLSSLDLDIRLGIDTETSLDVIQAGDIDRKEITLGFLTSTELNTGIPGFSFLADARIGGTMLFLFETDVSIGPSTVIDLLVLKGIIGSFGFGVGVTGSLFYGFGLIGPLKREGGIFERGFGFCLCIFSSSDDGNQSMMYFKYYLSAIDSPAFMTIGSDHMTMGFRYSFGL
jgi:hypothetical protein